MPKIEPKLVKRPCGVMLITKVWKSGSSIKCSKEGTMVSTPAPKDEGWMKARIELFCEGCKFNPSSCAKGGDEKRK